MNKYLDRAIDELLLVAHERPKLKLALVALVILGLSALFIKFLL